MTSGDALPHDLESLLRQALRPVEPPAALADRLESRLESITTLAAGELDAWELSSMRDPRNWTRVARPAAAAVVGTAAGTALFVLRARRNARKPPVPEGLLDRLPGALRSLGRDR